MQKVIHIFRPIGDGSHGIVEYEERKVDKKPTLNEMQELVGGLIERVEVKFEGKKTDMIINEEGLLKGLPFNPIATHIMQQTYDGYGHIVGTALIFEGFRL